MKIEENIDKIVLEILIESKGIKISLAKYLYRKHIDNEDIQDIERLSKNLFIFNSH